VACCDFVIFPPRWMVQLDTFRPPYFHRNCMTEFMGNIKGEYDAKPTGFAPGSGSLHSCMVPHGPDREAVDKALKADTHKPFYMEGALAFMFESTYVMRLTDWGLRVSRDEAYDQVWAGLDSMFRPTP
jgi:homogentisate 1,2-dioxygenase